MQNAGAPLNILSTIEQSDADRFATTQKVSHCKCSLQQLTSVFVTCDGTSDDTTGAMLQKDRNRLSASRDATILSVSRDL